MDQINALVALLPAKYAAAAFAALYLLAQLVPFLPVPAAGATGLYARLYPVINRIAGNYRNAANAATTPSTQVTK